MNIKAVGMDMYLVYQDVIKEGFRPKTLCVVDRFHLVEEFNTQVDKIWFSIQRSAFMNRTVLRQRFVD